MKLHPFGSGVDMTPHSLAFFLKGTRWEMRGVDRGPNNDFTVIDAGVETVYCITTPCPQPVFVLYRKTGSDDEPTRSRLADFESKFMRYGTVVTDLGKMTVTAKAPTSKYPWMLFVGAALLLS